MIEGRHDGIFKAAPFSARERLSEASASTGARMQQSARSISRSDREPSPHRSCDRGAKELGCDEGADIARVDTGERIARGAAKRHCRIGERGRRGKPVGSGDVGGHRESRPRPSEERRYLGLPQRGACRAPCQRLPMFFSSPWRDMRSSLARGNAVNNSIRRRKMSATSRKN